MLYTIQTDPKSLMQTLYLRYDGLGVVGITRPRDARLFRTKEDADAHLAKMDDAAVRFYDFVVLEHRAWFGKKEHGYWLSPVPEACQATGRPFDGVMYDMYVPAYGWGNYCHSFVEERLGVGFELGTGKGQRYEQQPDGKWLKVAG